MNSDTPIHITDEGTMKKKIFLHVGCGKKRKDRTTAAFNSDAWQEIRLDIDALVDPDIIADITDLSFVQKDSIDAIFSSHNIEHLEYHAVERALKEFRRVLHKDGFLVLTCPDLSLVCAQVVEGRLLDTLYNSPAGPITPMDVLFGHDESLRQGNTYMAHRCGFTPQTLVEKLEEADFGSILCIRRRSPFFDIWVIASKYEQSKTFLRKLAAEHFPENALGVTQ